MSGSLFFIQISMFVATQFSNSWMETTPKPEDLVKTSSRVFLSFNNDSTVEINILTHFAIAEGWHIYWKCPGGNGFPTSIKTDIKNTMLSSDTKYSFPKLFIQDGFESYGYEKEAWILKTETVGADQIPPKIKIDTSYFACKNICILGETSQTIAFEDYENRLADLKAGLNFDEALSRFPKRIFEVGGFYGQFNGKHFEAEFTGDIFNNNHMKKNLRWFPDPTPGMIYGDGEIRKTKDRLLIKIPIEISPENFLGVSPVIRILITCESESVKHHGYWVNMPLGNF